MKNPAEESSAGFFKIHRNLKFRLSELLLGFGREVCYNNERSIFKKRITLLSCCSMVK